MESTIGKRQGRGERNDAIVTARVPAEIKKQGNAVLREIGSTPTELVNAAYRYVLKERELPKEASPLAGLAGQHRILSLEQKERVRNRVRRTTLNAPADWGLEVIQGTACGSEGRAICAPFLTRMCSLIC